MSSHTLVGVPIRLLSHFCSATLKRSRSPDPLMPASSDKAQATNPEPAPKTAGRGQFVSSGHRWAPHDVRGSVPSCRATAHSWPRGGGHRWAPREERGAPCSDAQPSDIVGGFMFQSLQLPNQRQAALIQVRPELQSEHHTKALTLLSCVTSRNRACRGPACCLPHLWR